MTCILIIITCLLFILNKMNINLQIKKEQEEIEQKEKEEKDTIEYKANQTIRVKMSKTGEIVAMDINDYLRGVLPSEMPPSYDIEALKAQAVVARTYTYKKIQDKGEGVDADICDNPGHCQAFYPKEKILQIWAGRGFDDALRVTYWNKVNEAVVSTQNEVIMYQGQLIKAFFHASSPIKTEDISQIWGGEKLPYLASVENKESETYENRTSVVEITYADFIQKLKEDNSSRNTLTEELVKATCIDSYTTSGRVKNIKVGSYYISAEKLRTIFGLKSTNFTIECKENSIVFSVIGYGHGVGLSQVGANYDASLNMNYEQIIKHYYTGVEVVKLK